MSTILETRSVTPSTQGSPRVARWRSMIETLERRVTLTVTLLLVLVIGGMFWMSHSRVVDAVSSSEVSRLQTSAGELARVLTVQARRVIDSAAHLAAAPDLREALRGNANAATATL